MIQIIAKTQKNLLLEEIDKIILNLITNFDPEDEIEIERQEDRDCGYVIIKKVRNQPYLRIVK